MNDPERIQKRLTQMTKGSGCGCKIAPGALDHLLKAISLNNLKDQNVLVGQEFKDDAAVYDLGDGRALISTTDFFTPIVDDPFDFGRIAAANSISDIYAMGGKPIMALSVLGYPSELISADRVQKILEGGIKTCTEAGIALAGGHSIDAPEPFFGLAVSGIIETKNIKRNSSAKEGDLIYLTKPLGSGIYSAASKRELLPPADLEELTKQLTILNSAGEMLGGIDAVTAMTDVTGFGLLGHLLEVCEGSGLAAEISYEKIPLYRNVRTHIKNMCIPDNTYRNWNAFEGKIRGIDGESFITLSDPQTNGGLLVFVRPGSEKEIEEVFIEFKIDHTKPIGRLKTGEGIDII